MTDICCLNSYFLLRGAGGGGGSIISRMEFRVKLTGNLISNYHITEDRPLGRPSETAPPIRMNAHYPSYIAATV
jgi:hypothetical protein